MKFLRFALFAAVLLSLSAYVSAQRAPAPSPTVEPEAAEDVIRISSKLVLVDALVVDKDNNQIKDLKADDFEIYQDGKRQQITSFSYVDGARNSAPAGSPGKDGPERRENIPSAVPGGTRGRVITFVIDDGNCLASIEGIALARDSVKKFIAEKMLPDDKVAVYRTRGGSSLLQMYTSNKEVLRREVNKVSWAPSQCGSAFEPARDKSTIKVTGEGAESFESEADKETQKLIAEQESDKQVIGSIGVLKFVVDRLRELPERKLLFFVSEGVRTNFSSRAYDALRDLTDRASRAQVVIYAFGAKGLFNPDFISPQDEVLPGIIGGTDNTFALRDERQEEERALNEGMSYLAYSTGGKFIRNQNSLDDAMEKVLDVETGYYLLGYEPDDEIFEGKQYHRIQIRLKRPELTVTSRRGFIGREDKDSAAGYKNAANPVYKALASPFAENSLEVKMTPLVKGVSKKGGSVRTIFHIDGRGLVFTDEPGGLKKVVLNVVLVALDDKGRVAAEFNRSYPIRVPERAIDTIRRNGLDYSTDVEFSKPGIYSLRLAVQDDASGRLGTAGDYVEIPKESSKNFTIGSLVTTRFGEGDTPIVPGPRPVEAGFAPVFERSIPSLRQYKAGDRMAFVLDIQGARPISGSGDRFTAAVSVFAEGKPVLELSDVRIRLTGPNGVDSFGSIELPSDLAPGSYILQITITDKADRKTASRWIDFEVID
ncbi:MAG: VWA domain-containing protein [Aridibacter famidurans]|nr:VWA domain-containing protein [Aridibacter famidurans]